MTQLRMSYFNEIGCLPPPLNLIPSRWLLKKLLKGCGRRPRTYEPERYINRDGEYPVGTLTWWRNQMESFSALLVICAGNSPVSGEFPAQRPVTQSFDVSLISARINGWVNNREAGDFRRIRPHYDVTVMYTLTVELHYNTFKMTY